MNCNNTLCLIVDIQERLQPVMSDAAAVAKQSAVLIQGLAALGVPLAATEQYPQGLGTTVPEIKALLGGAPVFEKTRFSAFVPEVETLLQGKNIRNVILAGEETHICMLQTVLDLRQAGYAVYVPYDCTTSRSPANKENGLQQMRGAAAVVSNCESLLFLLLQDAAHPAFKTVSNLIR